MSKIWWRPVELHSDRVLGKGWFKQYALIVLLEFEPRDWWSGIFWKHFIREKGLLYIEFYLILIPCLPIHVSYRSAKWWMNPDPKSWEIERTDVLYEEEKVYPVLD